MAVLARKYLALLATSAPVERLFSKAGRIACPNRGGLKPSTIEQLLLAKCWMEEGIELKGSPDWVSAVQCLNIKS